MQATGAEEGERKREDREQRDGIEFWNACRALVENAEVAFRGFEAGSACSDFVKSVRYGVDAEPVEFASFIASGVPAHFRIVLVSDDAVQAGNLDVESDLGIALALAVLHELDVNFSFVNGNQFHWTARI